MFNFMNPGMMAGSYQKVRQEFEQSPAFRFRLGDISQIAQPGSYTGANAQGMATPGQQGFGYPQAAGFQQRTNIQNPMGMATPALSEPVQQPYYGQYDNMGYMQNDPRDMMQPPSFNGLQSIPGLLNYMQQGIPQRGLAQTLMAPRFFF